MSKHRRNTGFQIYNSALCGHVLERRNILICNKTLFTSNTCDNDNIETINHVPDFRRMHDQAQFKSCRVSRIYKFLKMSGEQGVSGRGPRGILKDKSVCQCGWC